MIELRLLGGVQLRATDGRKPELILAHEKSFALLAYLAAARPPGWHRRDSLVALLWPLLDQEHARTALRKAIHRLRQAFGAEAIVANGGESIGIAESVLWCDVRAFDAAVRGGRPADALALYRGDFLPGAFLSDAPDFERWVERERQLLRSTAARSAWLAADDAERSGQTANVIQWSRLAVALAPDDENGARRLITLLDKLGDRAGAIRAYEQFERYLASELDIGPASETAQLVDRIRQSSGPKPVRAASVTRSSSSEPAAGSAPSALDAVTVGSARPSPRPWRRLAAAAASVMALGVLSALIATRRPSEIPRALDETRVAVLPFENETGRSDLDFIGPEVQDWLTRGLQETGLVRVYAVDKPVAATSGGNGARPSDDARDRAAAFGAAMLIRGRYYLRADSILMGAAIVDVGTGNVLASLAPVVGAAIDPTAALDVLRRRCIAVLATHVDPALKQWASAASEPPSFEAYKEFSAGQQAQNRDDYDAAIGHFVRAASLDSGYVYPILMAAQLEMAVRSGDSAAALLRSVRARNIRLAPFDEALADALEAQLAHDFERAFAADQRLRRYVRPGSDWELEAASMAIALNRPRIALQIAKSVDLDRPGALDRWDVFVPITNAYHLAGENEAMLALLREKAGKWQHAAFIIVVEMQALAALGRPDEADSLWRTLLHNRAYESKGIAMWAAWMGASELRAHGFSNAARRLAAEALDSLPTLPDVSPWGNPMRWRMQVLREAGRFSEALPIARQIAAKNPKDANFAAMIAVLSAQLGDTATAERIEQKLANWPAASDPESVLIPRARLAAALGKRAEAVALLHAACDRGCGPFEDLHIILELDGLRSYPPFQQLLLPKAGY